MRIALIIVVVMIIYIGGIAIVGTLQGIKENTKK